MRIMCVRCLSVAWLRFAHLFFISRRCFFCEYHCTNVKLSLKQPVWIIVRWISVPYRICVICVLYATVVYEVICTFICHFVVFLLQVLLHQRETLAETTCLNHCAVNLHFWNIGGGGGSESAPLTCRGGGYFGRLLYVSWCMYIGCVVDIHLCELSIQTDQSKWPLSEQNRGWENSRRLLSGGPRAPGQWPTDHRSPSHWPVLPVSKWPPRP